MGQYTCYLISCTEHWMSEAIKRMQKTALLKSGAYKCDCPVEGSAVMTSNDKQRACLSAATSAWPADRRRDTDHTHAHESVSSKPRAERASRQVSCRSHGLSKSIHRGPTNRRAGGQTDGRAPRVMYAL